MKLKNIDPTRVISVGRTEHCVVIKYSGVTVQFWFYLTVTELANAANGNGVNQAWSDCGNVLHANYNLLTFYKHAGDVNGERQTKTATFRMDCAKFFKRIKQLVDDGVVTESKSVELCTDSFRRTNEEFPELGWADILRSDRFKAVSGLKEAMVVASASTMRLLKRLLSIKLSQGFTLYPDGGPSFYFEFRSGNAVSNGGIIYDRRNETYSIHT